MTKINSDLQKVNNQIDSIQEIHHEIFIDNLETLKLLVICYDYINFQLNRSLNDGKINDKLRLNEKKIGRLMVKTLDDIESDLIIQQWFHEDYGNDLLLKSNKNTMAIRSKIINFKHNYSKEIKNQEYLKVRNFIYRIINIMKTMGLEINVSANDLEAMQIINPYNSELNIIEFNKKFIKK